MSRSNVIGKVFGLGLLVFVIGVCLRFAATSLVNGTSLTTMFGGGYASMQRADTMATLSPWLLGLGVAWMVLSSSFAMLQSIRKD